MNNELFKAFLNTAPSDEANANYGWKQLRLVYGESTKRWHDWGQHKNQKSSFCHFNSRVNVWDHC